MTPSVTLLAALSLESADAGEEGVVSRDKGVVDSDAEAVDVSVKDVEGRDVAEGGNDVGVGVDDDGVGVRDECGVEVDKDEVGVVRVGLEEDRGGGVGAVEGNTTGEVSSEVLSTGEVVTTSGGRSEAGAGGRRSTGRGIPVA